MIQISNFAFSVVSLLPGARLNSIRVINSMKEKKIKLLILNFIGVGREFGSDSDVAAGNIYLLTRRASLDVVVYFSIF